ncbi:MAG: AAA+ family ATPase [Alphaproteobacteria bacterium]|nr:MAG: AAA+ family ATPase [Alphaproteobacteria bacterium]
MARRIVTAALVAGLAIQPALAGEGAEEVDKGFDLLREATKLILRGLMKEMEPKLKELEEILQNLDAYEAPEILPNGDIIIRRKRPLEPPAEEAVPEGEEIEL